MSQVRESQAETYEWDKLNDVQVMKNASRIYASKCIICNHRNLERF